MPLEIKKQARESSQSLVRRFGTRLRQSGILRRAREIRRKERPKSSRSKKEAALRRQELKEQYRRLQKLGKNKLSR